MRSKSLIFSVFSLMCVSLLAGCGKDKKHVIEAVSSSNEQGVVFGGGKYKEGATVSIKVYPNMGCSVQKYTFMKNGTDILEEGFFDNYPEEYSIVEFAANGETAGKYVVYYECNSAQPGESQDRITKYKVKYDVKDASNNPIIVAGTNNEVEVNSNAKLTPINYVDGIEGKIEWYSDSSFGERFDFNKLITSDITLYGKIETYSNEKIVQEAIETFKNREKLEIGYDADKTKATILNFNKIDTDFSKFAIFVRVEGIVKYIVDKENYYEFVDTNKSAGFSLKNSGYSISNIDSIYKYIELKDVNINDYVISVDEGDPNTTICLEYNNDGGCKTNKNAKKYILTKGDEEITLAIYNGKLYEFSKEEGKDFKIAYTDNVTAMSVDKPQDMYTVKLYSDNADLGEYLKDQTKLENVRKIVPAFGDNLKKSLEELNDELKKYDYDVVEYKNNACTEIPYNIDNPISQHLSLCLKVNATVADVFADSVTNALNTAGAVSKITTTINVEGFGDISREYEVYSADSIFAIADWDSSSENIDNNETSKMHEEVHASICELVKLLKEKEYHNVEVVDGKFKFYKKDSTVAYLSISLKDEKIYSISYFEPVEGNTYTSTFTY